MIDVVIGISFITALSMEEDGILSSKQKSAMALRELPEGYDASSTTTWPAATASKTGCEFMGNPNKILKQLAPDDLRRA